MGRWGSRRGWCTLCKWVRLATLTSFQGLFSLGTRLACGLFPHYTGYFPLPGLTITPQSSLYPLLLWVSFEKSHSVMQPANMMYSSQLEEQLQSLCMGTQYLPRILRSEAKTWLTMPAWKLTKSSLLYFFKPVWATETEISYQITYHSCKTL